MSTRDLKKLVNDLELTLTIRKKLRAAGINTVADLVQTTESELVLNKTLRRDSVEAVKEVLKSMGLSFGMELEAGEIPPPPPPPKKTVAELQEIVAARAEIPATVAAPAPAAQYGLAGGRYAFAVHPLNGPVRMEMPDEEKLRLIEQLQDQLETVATNIAENKRQESVDILRGVHAQVDVIATVFFVEARKLKGKRCP